MTAYTSGKSRAFGVFSTLGLFCVFALLALSVLLFGARAYKAIAERMDENYVIRTASSYISNKVRQHDGAGAVSVAEFGGGTALTLSETIEGGEYQTLIYYSGGAIRELFAVKGIEIDPDSGAEIVPAQGLAFEEREGGVAVRIEGAGRSAELFMSVRSEG